MAVQEWSRWPVRSRRIGCPEDETPRGVAFSDEPWTIQGIQGRGTQICSHRCKSLRRRPWDSRRGGEASSASMTPALGRGCALSFSIASRVGHRRIGGDYAPIALDAGSSPSPRPSPNPSILISAPKTASARHSPRRKKHGRSRRCLCARTRTPGTCSPVFARGLHIVGPHGSPEAAGPNHMAGVSSHLPLQIGSVLFGL